MAGLSETAILEPEEIERLAAVGVTTLSQVTETLNEPGERGALARLTGIDEETLWSLVCIADLCRVPGIGPKRALLLGRVEYASTVKDLAECDPHQLRLDLAARSLSLDCPIPSLRQLEALVESAQTTSPLLQPTLGPVQVDREFEATIRGEAARTWGLAKAASLICALLVIAACILSILQSLLLIGALCMAAWNQPGNAVAIAQFTLAAIILSFLPFSITGVLLWVGLMLPVALTAVLSPRLSRLVMKSRRHKALAIQARNVSFAVYDQLKAWGRSRVLAVLSAIVVSFTCLLCVAGTFVRDINHALAVLGPVAFVTAFAGLAVMSGLEVRKLRELQGWSRSFERRYVLTEVGMSVVQWSALGTCMAVAIWLGTNAYRIITINLVNYMLDALSRLHVLSIGLSEATQQFVEMIEKQAQDMHAGLLPMSWRIIAWGLALVFALVLARLIVIQGRKALIFIGVTAALGWLWEATLVPTLPVLLGEETGSILAWAIRLTFLPIGFFITDYVYEWIASEEATCPVCEWDTDPEDTYCGGCGARLDHFPRARRTYQPFKRLSSLVGSVSRDGGLSRDNNT